MIGLISSSCATRSSKRRNLQCGLALLQFERLLAISELEEIANRWINPELLASNPLSLTKQPDLGDRGVLAGGEMNPSRQKSILSSVIFEGTILVITGWLLGCGCPRQDASIMIEGIIMSYDSTRDAEQLRIITPAIDAFITRYNNNTQYAANGGRHTIFLFPGGMASALKQATSPYVDGVSTPQLFNYEPLWVEPFIFIDGRAAELKLNRVSKPEYRDNNDQIIVADGSVEFLGCTPYVGFTRWCEQSGFDYFVFGWDWRRKLQHTGRFFIEKFLPFFQARVKSKCNNGDPLAKFSLIGHSAGGMVVNWIFARITRTQPICTVRSRSRRRSMAMAGKCIDGSMANPT